jgi:hypothetical protein
MNTEAITMIGLLITTAVTILGWLYTAATQRKILDEGRKSHKLDRELAVFRERLSIIRGITATLIDLSIPYSELFALIHTGQFTLDSGAAALRGGDASPKDLMKILSDPGFRSMLTLLPAPERELVETRLSKLTTMLGAFHAHNVGLSPITADYAARLSEIGNTALAVSNELTDVADLLAEEFAFLDRALAKGE